MIFSNLNIFIKFTDFISYYQKFYIKIMDTKYNTLTMPLNVKYILFFILIITITNCQNIKNMSTIQIGIIYIINI
jgi:hypothetical protein